ncbi:hypothetical protein SKAU_G00322260 [Synaphobranchus kaupii]|uniref:Uncharacterized protein n=1 Tax=Synaphobranchus kaupii TaxID=118154 RepID=A0A9Q1IHR5_SYNKA|nr:hypothetical protein SKAU_G00322260 [Synaphobranchus kaupii]
MSSKRDISKGTNRALKPVIEKKRRDRINQSLDELRTLLLSHTLDTRLQNPKLEKAEILELTVEYIRNKTNRETASCNRDTGVKAQSSDGVPQKRPHSEGGPPASGSLYSAGFQQCVSRLSTFMDCVNPAQRRSLVRGLQNYLGPPSPPYQGTHPETPYHPETAQNGGGDVSAWLESQAYPHTSVPLYPNPLVLHPLPSQTLAHPFPSPPYSLSPPPSPCYTNASPTFLSATAPPEPLPRLPLIGRPAPSLAGPAHSSPAHRAPLSGQEGAAAGSPETGAFPPAVRCHVEAVVLNPRIPAGSPQDPSSSSQPSPDHELSTGGCILSSPALPR